MKYRVMRALVTPLMGLLLMPGGALHAAPPAPREWKDAGTGIEFVWVAPGCFDMGASAAPGGERDGVPLTPRSDEVPKHRVCLDGYWMGRYELTRAQWHRVMAPQTRDIENAQQPMVRVSWLDVQQFLQRLNANAAAGVRFRLPTEAEWEYACQPGEPKNDIIEKSEQREEELAVTTWFRVNKARHMNDVDVSALYPSDVGTRAANPLGLHDMLGNVWEWVEDSYRPDAYKHHARKNPRMAEKEERKVLRGGSFKSGAEQVRCGARNFGLIDDPLPTVGLRLVGEKSGRNAR